MFQIKDEGGTSKEQQSGVENDNLSEEEFALVSEKSDPKIQFKFKLLEFFTGNGITTAKK